MFELTITRHRQTPEVRTFATRDALHAELLAMGVPPRYFTQGYWAFDERYDWTERADVPDVCGTPVATRWHGHCGGTGTFIAASGVPAVCQGCGGRGRIPVYTEAQKRELARMDARRAWALNRIKACARDTATSEFDGFADTVRSGFDQLEAREPNRLEKLYDSMESGRIAIVVQALHDYRVQLDTRNASVV